MPKCLKIKVGDVLLISFIFILSVFLLILPFFSNKSKSAEIVNAETGEKLIVSLEENSEYEITSQGMTLTVCVNNGEIFVLKSSCRDGICSNTPPISRSGQTIVCAPAGVVIRVLGKEAYVDGVSK